MQSCHALSRSNFGAVNCRQSQEPSKILELPAKQEWQGRQHLHEADKGVDALALDRMLHRHDSSLCAQVAGCEGALHLGCPYPVPAHIDDIIHAACDSEQQLSEPLAMHNGAVSGAMQYLMSAGCHAHRDSCAEGSQGT